MLGNLWIDMPATAPHAIPSRKEERTPIGTPWCPWPPVKNAEGKITGIGHAPIRGISADVAILVIFR